MKPNSSFKKTLACSLLFLSSQAAHSVIIMTLTPTPTGADLTITGSFDYAGLNTMDASYSTSNNFIVDSDSQIAGFRSDGALGQSDGELTAIFGSGFSGDPLSGNLTAEIPFSGDVIPGWGFSGNAIFFPTSYVSGSQVSLSGTYTGNIFEGNGGTLIPNQATRLSFSNGDAIIFSTGRGIPEPSAPMLTAAGVLIACLRRRRIESETT